MAKKKIMKLSQGLVLNRYLLSLFGCTEFEQMAIHLRASNLEGYDEENISKFHTAIKLWLNSDKLSKDLLLEAAGFPLPGKHGKSSLLPSHCLSNALQVSKKAHL